MRESGTLVMTSDLSARGRPKNLKLKSAVVIAGRIPPGKVLSSSLVADESGDRGLHFN